MIVKSITKALGTVAAVTLLVAGASSAARAGSAFFETDFTRSGYHYQATALFEVVGGNLQLTLANTATQDVMNPAQVLTALFFDVSGATLTPVSATLGSGSTIWLNDTQLNLGTNVGGEWRYDSGLGSAAPARSGVSAAGLGVFGNSPNFNGPDLSSPPQANLDGLDFAITAAGDNPLTPGVGDVKNSELINNKVVFLFSGLPTGGFDPSVGISNVWFQYGTTLSGDTIFPPVPEPAFYQMAGFLSLGGLGLLKLRRRRK